MEPQGEDAALWPGAGDADGGTRPRELGDLEEEGAAPGIPSDVPTDAIDPGGDAVWVRKWDDATNSLYYFNLRTQESSWEAPRAYKSILESEPIGLDDGETDAQVTTEQQEKDPNKEAAKIQSVYRGCSTRNKLKGARHWVEQYDPSAARMYYYNSVTGKSQWEKPADFTEGVQDDKTEGAVKIQSAYRAKRARNRVRQLAEEEEQEEREERENAEQETQRKQETKPLTPPAVWSEYFDPRTQRYYYRHAITDAITWEKPESFNPARMERGRRDTAALSIQCAIRKRLASNDLGAKRERLHELTDAGAMEAKLNELKRVVDEIQAEMQTRSLASPTEEQQFPHLLGLTTEWSQSLQQLRDKVQALSCRADDIQLAECLPERIAHGERFHKSLGELKGDCLALLRSILLMNSYFVELDVARINTACATFAKWKSHELCALADPRLMQSLQISDLSELLERVEALLRGAMGLTDFSTGTTSAVGKRYEDWHASVVAALTGVHDLEQRLTHKSHLLSAYRAAEDMEREISLMKQEELLVLQLAQMQKRRVHEAENHAAFLAECQKNWKAGLAQREEDLRVLAVQENAERQEKLMHHERMQKFKQEELDRLQRSKLSIWEAVKEGLAVEAIRAMVFAEMQKARRLGYDFVVKTARSDHNETLIQIACWWGHEHLVHFFLEEGANLHGVDSYCNRFSLLHDAARRGHSHVIRILMERGLRCDVLDSAGDTPIHWAARKSHYEAVLTLLGVYASHRDQALVEDALRAVRLKNYRGKTPQTLAKSDRLRNLLKAAEEGRLPHTRRPRTGDSTASGKSRRKTESVPMRKSRGSFLTVTDKPAVMLGRTTKYGSTNALPI